MSIDITYNGNKIAALEGGKTAIIKCAGKKMKSDLTVIAPEGGGGGGGDCPINIVDELPAEGVEGEVYGLHALTDILAVMVIPDYGGIPQSIGDGLDGIITTSETFATIEPVEGIVCYVTDIPEIYLYAEGAWHTVLELMGNQAQYMTGGCLGEITNIDEVDTSTGGYYAVVGYIFYKYINGEYKKLITKGGVRFESNGDGTCKVTGLEDNYDMNLVIPSVSPDGDTVTSIGSGAFYNYDNANKYAFASVTIPDTVTLISNSAFTNAALKTITIPASVKIIGMNAFEKSTLGTVTISDGVTEIQHYAFKYCRNLVSIVIPDSVTSLGDDMFAYCSSLANVTLSKNITELRQWAFYNCTSLNNLDLSNTAITKFGNYVFQNCTSLSSITLPATLTRLDSNDFYGCTALKTITFAGTVEQWNAITKDDGWNQYVPATKIVCSDGEVTL